MKSLSDIKFLSFEGGGGKGNAYVGALAALQKLNIIHFGGNRLLGNIRGISGASAGAITALLLGSGYSYEEFYRIMQSRDFNTFFDYPVVGSNVVAGKGFSYFDEDQAKKNIKKSPKWLRVLLNGLAKTGVLDSQINNHLANENSVLADKLKGNLNKYLACLIADWGLFSGANIQEQFFEELVQFKIYCIQNKLTTEFLNQPQNKQLQQNSMQNVRDLILTDTFKPCTFQEHFNFFGIELAFTSVNFTSENVQVFSYKTCPNFPISTAARMSMSLPLIYKPVIVNQESLKLLSLSGDFEGLWVDGGLFDNAPARVFNNVANTVLFRLGNRQAHNQIENLLEFIKVYLKIGILGSGSGQVNRTTVPDLNVVELDVSGLSLLKFNLPKLEFDDLANKNAKIVYDYFQGWQP
jgi:predicted acylesterase/phospholipase RssA